jgi:hypothetical protein
MQPDYEHHDPLADSGRAGLEKLMALGVLGEAGGRYAAERARVRLARQEQAADRERASEAVRDKAERLERAQHARQQRQWRTLVSDPARLARHMGQLPVHEVARHWGLAAGSAGRDPLAGAVLAAAEKELRARMPTLMQSYDRARHGGADRYDAMRAAVTDVLGDRSRAQDGKLALPVLQVELEQHLRRHAGRLDPAARARWLHALEERGWSPESVAWAEAVLAGTEDQRRTAAANHAAVDDPATPADERTGGLVVAGVAAGRADDLARDARAQAATAGHPVRRAGGSEPGVGAAPPGPAGLSRLSYPTPPEAVLRPAVPPAAASQATAQRQANRKGRTR